MKEKFITCILGYAPGGRRARRKAVVQAGSSNNSLFRAATAALVWLRRQDFIYFQLCQAIEARAGQKRDEADWELGLLPKDSDGSAKISRVAIIQILLSDTVAQVRCSPRFEWYNSAMKIGLPDNEIEALHLTPEKVRIELAVGLYAGRQVTLGRAAKIAGISYTAFMHEIGRRGICLNYRVEDALHDLEMADELCRKASPA